MEVEPADKNALSFQLLQICKLLSLLEKTVNLWAFSESNRLHGKNANKLPQNTEHKVGSLIEESLSINSNNLDHGLGDGESLIEILSHLVDVEL